MVKEAKKYLNQNPKYIDDSNYEAYLKDNETFPKVVIFTNRDKIKTFHKALVNEFGDKMDIYLVKKGNLNIEAKFKVTSHPQIFVYKITEKQPI